MASRPRRSAAQRATAAITDMAADSDHGVSSRSRRSTDAKTISTSRDRDWSTDRQSSSASAESYHVPVTVKVTSSRLRQATAPRPTRASISVNGRDQSVGGEIMAGKRSTRGTKKRYVESESEEEEEEEQDEIQVVDQDADGDDDDDEMEDVAEEDAEGEADDDLDVDAKGEEEDVGDEDAEGEVEDMDVDPVVPAIKVTKPPRNSSETKSKAAATSRKASSSSRRASAQKATAAAAEEEEEDEELSELDSDVGDPNETVQTVGGTELGDEDAEGEDVDIDAEGEEIEVAAEQEDEEDDDDDDLGSDGDGASREETPDVSKMTKRQRARFEDGPQEYMKLSDEVQVKKVFTAEELSMRRAEMARRRRNLSEKRNEEVKMETINKLLKKQPTKNSRRAAGQENEAPEDEAPQAANPRFIRWVSNKNGCQISVPVEIVESPVGRLFAAGGTTRKMVEEV